MIRHHIRIGDKTTANGVVVSAASGFTLLDREVALEGDKIACRSCHSTGTIVCIGPRIPEDFHGRQVALEGDLCVCRCPRPPRLIPSQSLRYQDVEGSYAEAMGGPSFGTRAAAPLAPDAAARSAPASSADDSQAEGFDQHFLLTDEVTGEPLANRFYRMTSNGQTIEGYTNDEGLTERVEADAAVDVQIEVFPEGYAGAAA